MSARGRSSTRRPRETPGRRPPLAGSIAPGRHLLVQLGPTGTVGSPLPAPDVTGTTNLAASGGKIALVHDSTAILCGASPGSCAGVATLQDLVGYGSATDYEGTAAAPALDATTAAVRAGGGCTDTDSNTADFTGAAPAPQSSAAAAAPCAGTPPSGSSVQSVAIDADVAPVISIALEHPSISFGQVVDGHAPVSALRAHHRLQHPLDRLRADRPSHRVRSGRPAARPHCDEPGRRRRQPRVRRRRTRCDPAVDEHRSVDRLRHAGGARCGRQLARLDRLHRAACRRSRPATTPARSRSR